jgi:hypothetical protein
MAEDDPITPPSSELSWSRSPEFDLIFSNFYKTRIGTGDFTLTFASLRDAPGIASVNDIKEHVQIAMSWPMLKMLSMSLKTTVDAIENQLGPIAIPDGFSPDWDHAISIVQGLRLKT